MGRSEGNDIVILARDWRQLFDSRDPAPFFERDLDDDAAEYLIDSLLDLGRRAERVVIKLTGPQSGLGDTAELGKAIHQYFSYALLRRRIRHKQLLKEGVAALAVGLTLLVLAMVAITRMAHAESEPTTRLLRESFLIFAWVAMWRPFDILVYSWWPYLSERQVISKLARIPIEVRTDT